MSNLDKNDPIAIKVVAAIQKGDLDGLDRLLADDPSLVTARIRERSLLHIATDWPGHFPNVAAVVTKLIAAGADPNAPGTGPAPEAPLHWAASSDDVEAIDALLDGGADIEVTGASIAGGTPLEDAVGYGQWNAARRLLERGAQVDKLWHAAALGLMSKIEAFFAAGQNPTPVEVNDAFWQACHGGQRPAAEYLLARGADLNWIPDWNKDAPLDIAVQSGASDVVEWLRARGAKSAKEPG
jgi:ankyrin repeat protein